MAGSKQIDVAAMDEIRMIALMKNLSYDTEKKYPGNPAAARDAAAFREKLVGFDDASVQGRAELLANLKANPDLAQALLSRDQSPQLRQRMGMSDGAFLKDPFALNDPQKLQNAGAALQHMNAGQPAAQRQPISMQRSASVQLTEAEMVQRLSDNSRAAEARFPELAQQASAYRAQLTATDPASQQLRADMLRNYQNNPEAAALHLNRVTAAQLDKIGKDDLRASLQKPYDMADPGMAKLVNGFVRADQPLDVKRLTSEEMVTRLANHSIDMELKYPALAAKAQAFRDKLTDDSPAAVAERNQMLANMKRFPNLAENKLGLNGANANGATLTAANDFLSDTTKLSDPRKAFAENVKLAVAANPAITAAPQAQAWGGPSSRRQQPGVPSSVPGIVSVLATAGSTIMSLVMGANALGAAQAQAAPVATPPLQPAVSTPVVGHTAPVVPTSLPPLSPLPAATPPTVTAAPAASPAVTPATQPVVSPAQTAATAAPPPAAVAPEVNKDELWKDLQKKFDLDEAKLAEFRKNIDTPTAPKADASSMQASVKPATLTI